MVIFTALFPMDEAVGAADRVLVECWELFVSLLCTDVVVVSSGLLLAVCDRKTECTPST